MTENVMLLICSRGDQDGPFTSQYMEMNNIKTHQSNLIVPCFCAALQVKISHFNFFYTWTRAMWNVTDLIDSLALSVIGFGSNSTADCLAPNDVISAT